MEGAAGAGNDRGPRFSAGTPVVQLPVYSFLFFVSRALVDVFSRDPRAAFPRAAFRDL